MRDGPTSTTLTATADLFPAALTAAPHLPSTTVLLPRLNVFQPTFFPIDLDTGWIGPATARCRVQGRIGQRHQGVLEAIMHNALDVRTVVGPGGGLDLVEVTADPARIRRAIATGPEPYGEQTFVGLLKDLARTLVSIDYTRAGERHQITGSILTEFARHTPVPKPLWNPLTRQRDRSAWTFRLGRTFLCLYGFDIPRFWDPAIFQPLTTGIGQAVARYVLAHAHDPRGGWKLDTLIHAVLPGAIGPGMLRKRRHELRLAATAFATLGIEVKNDRVRRLDPASGGRRP